MTAIFDFAGDDHYASAGSGVSQSHNSATSVLFDGQGNDVYAGAHAGEAGPGSDYHAKMKTGSNFSFVIDLGGGEDTYPDGLENNADHTRGWSGGFVIDRRTGAK